MIIRQITDTYFVAPQIDPEDFAALKSQDFCRVIANRPDSEVPESHQVEAMEACALAAGLEFVKLPLTHQTMTPENVQAHAEAISEAPGKVLAYCASRTRSTVVWALGQARSGTMSVNDILAAVAAGGYDLENLRATLDAFVQQRG